MRSILILTVCLAAGTFLPEGHAQHAHLNAGALGSAPGTTLSFINGATFATNSGYVIPMTQATTGPTAGLYQQSTFNFTSLPATGDFGGPAFGHAAPGARLALQVIGVAGPAGGVLGFWESDGESPGGEMTFSVPVGSSEVSGEFLLTEGPDEPGGDPYGHIHGRLFTFDQPGLYTVTFRLVDRSGRGLDGGPIHPPSEPFPLYFQAGLTLAAIAVVPDSVQLTFATTSGRGYSIERTSALGDDVVWTLVEGPILGTGRLMTLSLPQPVGDQAWYRLRAD